MLACPRSLLTASAFAWLLHHRLTADPFVSCDSPPATRQWISIALLPSNAALASILISLYDKPKRPTHSRRTSAMKRLLPAGLCWLLVALPLHAQSDTQKQATIAYLQKLQTGEGGFRADARAKEADLSATTSAFRALKY